MCFQNASPHPTMDSMNSYTATNPVADRAAGGLSSRSGGFKTARPHKCAKRLFVNHAGYCSRSAKACTERKLQVLSLSNGSNRSKCSIARPTQSCEAAFISSGTPITNHHSSLSRTVKVTRIIKVNPSKSSTTFSAKCRNRIPSAAIDETPLKTLAQRTADSG